MRRKRISQSWPVSLRKGVSASVMSSIRNAQIPMKSCVASTGFAPRPSPTILKATRFIQMNGAKQALNHRGLITKRTCCVFGKLMDAGYSIAEISASVLALWWRVGNSEIAAQVHAFIKAGNLLAIAVEHQCRYFGCKEPSADGPFASLTPAGMINLGIHVRIETIFIGR